MVEVTEIIEDEQQQQAPAEVVPPPSEERTLDANEIESLCQQYVTRPSVKAHLSSLVQKIRRDAQALKRMEESRKKMEKEQEEKIEVDEDEEKVVVEEVEPNKPAATATSAPATAPVAASTTAKLTPPPTVSKPSPSQKYKSIDKFAFDAGSYNSPTVTIYITNLPNINSIPRENITCDFTPTSFDLKIHDFQGCNHRLLKDNLDKDINPEKSKIIVKSSKIIIKLGKIKSEYGSYDSWMDLTSKKSKETKMRSKSSDPSAGIMDMMKEMYDSGDDNMKKMIGETMLKQREGKLDGPKGMGDMGMDM